MIYANEKKVDMTFRSCRYISNCLFKHCCDIEMLQKQTGREMNKTRSENVRRNFKNNIKRAIYGNSLSNGCDSISSRLCKTPLLLGDSAHLLKTFKDLTHIHTDKTHYKYKESWTRNGEKPAKLPNTPASVCDGS